MKVWRGLCGVLLACGLLAVTFFGSFRVVIFNRNYMNRELTRLGIAEQVSMTQEDLMAVFDEILDYLAGKRADLVIETTVAGEQREAFNEREKAHMEDGLGLFEQGFRIYYAGAALAVLMLVPVLVWRRERRELLRVYGKCTVIVFAVFFILGGLVGILLATDFDFYFTLFHKIFFNNDLWLLDPRTDLMINLVPEPFFMHTALTIGGIFLAAALLILIGASLLWRRLSPSQKHEKG